MQDFFAYVKHLSDENPYGKGMDVYRFLVKWGVDDILQDAYSSIYEALGDEDWNTLITAFIQQSDWRSPYVQDIPEAFKQYILAQNLSN
jgi:hypothetical protein